MEQVGPRDRNSSGSTMIRGRKSRSNKAQIRTLVDFMLSNSNLATAEYAGPLGTKRANAQWLKLKDLLKNVGPDRSVEQWKQTWKDLKKSARQESALCAQALQEDTTGDSSNIPVVSEMTKKILDTIGRESTTGTGPVDSTIDPDSRTEARLQKCWENIKNRRKPVLEKRALTVTRSRSLEESLSTVQDEGLDISPSDPLLSVKVEVPPWSHTRDDDSDSISKEYEVAEVSQDAASPAYDASRLIDDEFPHLGTQTQGLELEDRCQERIEELHRLKVAEQVWTLKTIRERLATAQLERERAQLERERAQLEQKRAREDTEKAKLEREKASFERDAAEFQREKALLELQRAKRADTENNYDR